MRSSVAAASLEGWLGEKQVPILADELVFLLKSDFMLGYSFYKIVGGIEYEEYF